MLKALANATGPLSDADRVSINAQQFKQDFYSRFQPLPTSAGGTASARAATRSGSSSSSASAATASANAGADLDAFTEEDIAKVRQYRYTM